MKERWQRKIARAGLVGDPTGDVLEMFPEWTDEIRSLVDRIEAATQHRPLPPLKPSQLRSTLTPEAWRRMALAALALLVAGVVIGGAAAWYGRGAQIVSHCYTLYQADVCQAIMR